MLEREMDATLDPRGAVDQLDGVNYRDYTKKESKTTSMTLNKGDMWNGKSHPRYPMGIPESYAK